MYRVWYSTESFADFIIDNTVLSGKEVVKNKLYESDANNPKRFYTMPDHIRKILYLDAPDLIVEFNNEPIFSIEVTTEAGTGHNAFQRFARIAAAVENSVPAFYIYPEGAIISRKGTSTKWDGINPLVFRALEAVMSIYDIPALLYYFPSDMRTHLNQPTLSPNLARKGLRYDSDIVNYPGCPDSTDSDMQDMFKVLNTIVIDTESKGVVNAQIGLLRDLNVRNRRNFMQEQFFEKANGKLFTNMSPLTAVEEVPTRFITNYLNKYEDADYQLGELLKGRETTVLYEVDANFRGDPYPGALAAIDYLVCREGKTFEDRKKNLILVFGALEVDRTDETIRVINDKNITIKDFFKAVKGTEKHNLLTKDYDELRNFDIPRYMMQVRYGSTYSKVKHIRVFSYFADAILFPDGSLWRDA